MRHETGPHPENARRLVAIEAALEREGGPGIERVQAPPATREQVTRVHGEAHYDAIEEFCASGGGAIDADTLASPESFDAALHAAGGAVAAADALLGPRAIQDQVNALFGNVSKQQIRREQTGETVAGAALQDPGMLTEQRLRSVAGEGSLVGEEGDLQLNEVSGKGHVEATLST